MTLPTLTRGLFWRDDFVTATWSAQTGVTATTDGDILSLSGTDATHGYIQASAPDFSTTTYPYVIVRAKGTGTIDVKVFFSSGDQTFTLSLGTNYTAFVNTITPGKTLVGSVEFFNQSVPGTNSIDFVYFFKETLTLPSVTRATPVPKKRYVTKLQILQREGDIYQDLGSSSPEFHLGGSLVMTSQYSADDWNRVFDGLVLEQATVQADGNPTWQWFNHDLWQRKVLIADYTPQDVPGRQRNTMNDYTLRLVQFDTISETAGAINALQ